MKLSNKRETCIIILILLIILFIFSLNVDVNAQENSQREDASIENIENIQKELLENQIQSAEIKQLKEYIEEYSLNQMEKLFGGYSPEKMIQDIIKGNLKFNVKDLVKRSFVFFTQEVYLNLHILLKLIILIVLCALLKNLQASFLREGVGELAFFICYIVGVSLMVIGFKEASALGVGVVERMVGFMYATVPIMVTLLISGGNVASGGIFQPILIMVVEIAATFIKNVFMPLIFLSTVLSIINNISDKVHLSKLSELVKKIGTISIGIILTVFIGIITVQGSVGAVVDGVASKTIKFAIGTFIPVVGGYLSDAADMVIGCSLLIKNAAGAIVMIGLIAICLIPIIKIAAITLLYKITCALVEPISDKRITNCINDIANSMILIIGAVAVVAFMFIVAITAIVVAGNLSAMIR
ncbi:MAG: stage III sporulation protein AE [Firmicutes bacterium]|nr:stage III sporulation protein AE [Bacillota bacterium]